MPEKDSPRPPDDELTAKLRAAVRSRRPTSMARILFLAGLLLAPVVAFVMLYEPRTPEVPLVAIAFDALTVAGHDVELIARVFPSEPSENARLDGRDFLFEPEGADAHRQSASTDSQGVARVKWKPSEKMSDFLLRWPQGRIADQARIIAIPATASLVVVDVESTLTSAQPESWRTENILDIPAIGESKGALRALADKEREIIYFALAGAEPYTHRKVRGWMENRFAEGWPTGPVIGRKTYNTGSGPEGEFTKLVAELRKKFSGPLSVIVGNKDLAKAVGSGEWTTYLLGEHEATPGCIVVAHWTALMEKK